MNQEIIMMIAGAALVTYATRFPLLVFDGSRKLPPGFGKYLGFIAPAVLTALIAPAIFVKHGAMDFSWRNPYLPAAAVAGLAAYFSKSPLVAVLTGVVTVGLLTLFH